MVTGPNAEKKILEYGIALGAIHCQLLAPKVSTRNNLFATNDRLLGVKCSLIRFIVELWGL